MREIIWLVGTNSEDLECINFFGWDFSYIIVGKEIYSVAIAEDLRVFIWKGDTLYVLPNLEEAEREFGDVLRKFGVREYLKSINRI